MILERLLEHAEFGLELVSGGVAAHERPVLGAHTLEEIDDPLSWVPEGWIMLTTGVRLSSRAEQRRLVAELADGGVCALGFGVGFGFDAVPDPLLEQAQSRGFPVFTVPKLTPFRAIVRHVDSAVLASDLHVLRRAFSMHSFLLDALGQPDPEAALVARIGQLLSCDAALFRHDGRVIAATRHERAGEWWRTLCEARAAAVAPSSVVEAGPLLAAHAASDGSPHTWIVAVGANGGLGRPLVHRIVTSTVPILAALRNARGHARREERAMRAGLLDELLAGDPRTGRARSIRRRALVYGIDLDRAVRVALFVPATGTEREAAGAAPDLADALARALDRGAVPHLVAPHGAGVAVLVQADGDLAGARAQLAASGLEVACGVGRAVTGTGHLQQALRDAEIAVQRAQTAGAAGFARYDDLDLAAWVVLQAGESAVRDKALELLAPIADRPELLATLRAYLQHAMDVPATAGHLHIHQNSLRYRLTRIEQLLGRNLHDAGDLSAVHLALLATGGSLRNASSD